MVDLGNDRFARVHHAVLSPLHLSCCCCLPVCPSYHSERTHRQYSSTNKYDPPRLIVENQSERHLKSLAVANNTHTHTHRNKMERKKKKQIIKTIFFLVVLAQHAATHKTSERICIRCLAPSHALSLSLSLCRTCLPIVCLHSLFDVSSPIFGTHVQTRREQILGASRFGRKMCTFPKLSKRVSISCAFHSIHMPFLARWFTIHFDRTNAMCTVHTRNLAGSLFNHSFSVRVSLSLSRRIHICLLLACSLARSLHRAAPRVCVRSAGIRHMYEYILLCV